MRFAINLLLGSFMAMVLLQPFARAADEPTIPNFWDPQEKFIRPDLTDLPRLRFLTTTDFPPFSYIDGQKRLSGFHVDLARAICAELQVMKVCQIQALPFDEIEGAINGGQGEAALAGIRISRISRQRLSFTRPYFRVPARFVAPKTSNFSEPMVKSLAGKVVGVVAGTAHAAFAREKFSRMNIRLFATLDTALAAMTAGQTQATFSDAIALSFWLQDTKGSACCRFVGDPYLSGDHFGRGLAIAVAPGNVELREGINFALRSINDKGIFSELYLRYFPISLF